MKIGENMVWRAVHFWFYVFLVMVNFNQNVKETRPVHAGCHASILEVLESGARCVFNGHVFSQYFISMYDMLHSRITQESILCSAT